MWRVQLTFHHSWRLITAVSRSREHDSPYDSHAKLVTRIIGRNTIVVFYAIKLGYT